MKLFIQTIVLFAIANGVIAFAPMARRLAIAGLPIVSSQPSHHHMVENVDTHQHTDSVLANDDLSLIHALCDQCEQDDGTLQDLVLQALPNMSAKLIMALKTNQLASSASTSDKAFQRAAAALQALLDSQLSQGREVLAALLSAGELRKLDNEIGKANRAGKLDMAFFTVLNMNLKDAAEQQKQQTQAPQADEDTNENNDSTGASRFAVLTHIYTRCHEEVESSLPPGVVLLNKLLRTSVDSIRANQLQYYLCPRPAVITLPDGQVIPVTKNTGFNNGTNANDPLVHPSLLIQALADAVLQVRTVEQAGGMTREAAGNMVESCRSVAKEARMVLAREYGVDSDVLKAFEEGLQPVFRPASGESEFIRGA